MIPLSITKRPIAGSAFLLAVMSFFFAIFGSPIDIAMFPPLLWMVLIFGVYLPHLELGLNSLKSTEASQIAAICIIIGIGINPVLAWLISILLENFKIIKIPEDNRQPSEKETAVTAILAVISLVSFLVTYLK